MRHNNSALRRPANAPLESKSDSLEPFVRRVSPGVQPEAKPLYESKTGPSGDLAGRYRSPQPGSDDVGVAVSLRHIFSDPQYVSDTPVEYNIRVAGGSESLGSDLGTNRCCSCGH